MRKQFKFAAVGLAVSLGLSAIVAVECRWRPQAPNLRGVPEHTFYAKVAHVDAAKGELELTLAIQPQETRFILSPMKIEAADVAPGDYVRFSIEAKNRVRIGKKVFQITKVLWVTE